MRFILPRNKTVTSTCGLSIEFKKNELTLVPPHMYAEVIAVGGVPESELSDDEKPTAPAAPSDLEVRKQAIFKAYETIALRNIVTEFTAGGMPHLAVIAKETGWTIPSKERDATWAEFQARND